MSPQANQEQKRARGGASEFESVALLLQGGGALGSYQAGVYEALAEAGIQPDWIGGISIGAINGAIIAGNQPALRVEKLRGFWEEVSGNPLWDFYSCHNPMMQHCSESVRHYLHQISASVSATQGVRGFFKPHPMPPWFYPPGDPQATSYYSTEGFRETLEKFIDFDRLNADSVRFTTSAVNIRTGNYTIFDSTRQVIRPEHVMASGALPPALPAVEIDGDPYWDGGLISNTPLYWLMDGDTQTNTATKDTLIFQVDLWSAEGEEPQDMIEVMSRQKEIQYSSRTRGITNLFKQQQKLQHAFATLYEKLPDDLKQSDEAKLLHANSGHSVHNIVHLIYRARHYQIYAKDYEFSRMAVMDHWREGYKDTINSLRHEEIFRLPTCAEGYNVYDVTGTKGRVGQKS